MNDWIDELCEVLAAGKSCVLVTVAGSRGSAPRETGAKMLVTENETIGTIGGGQLEYKCAQIACGELGGDASGSQLRKFTLGANCGQCCGGVVDILFEPFRAGQTIWPEALRESHRRRESVVMATLPNRLQQDGKYLFDANGDIIYPADSAADDRLRREAMRILHEGQSAQSVRIKMNDGEGESALIEPVASSKLNISIFGAGHVGTATVNILSSLDCSIRWIDSRRNIFPRPLPDNVQAIESDRPELEVAAMPDGTFYLVMTHSHPLDQEVIQQILGRDDFAYCGLIGSLSKRRRFEKRLRRLGMAQSRIDKMSCPIGIDGIDGKKPAEIAISVAAELLRIVETRSAAGNEDLPDNVSMLRQ
jgi:xanthine dehydrogenase accessory factor